MSNFTAAPVVASIDELWRNVSDRTDELDGNEATVPVILGGLPR